MEQRIASDLVYASEPPRGYVANLIARDLFILARDAGLSADAVLEGTPFEPGSIWDTEAAVFWPSYCKMWDNVVSHLTDDSVVAIGSRYLEVGSMRPVVDLARSMRDPVDLYRTFSGMGRRRTVDCIDHTFEQLPDGRLELAANTAEGFEVCRGFLRARLGMFRALPTLAGFPPARVEYREHARGAIYIIDAPRLSSRYAQLLRWFRGWGAVLWQRRRLSRSMELLGQRHDAAQQLIITLQQKLADVSQSQDRFDHMFRAAPVAMLTCRTSDMVVVDVNDKFLSATGFDRATVMKWSPKMLGAWAETADRDKMLAAMAETGGRLEGVEVCARKVDGQDMVALMSVEPVDLGDEACLLFQAVDITERKQNEIELAEYRERLEELVEERSEELRLSNESLRQFERLASIGTLAAGIAHQINNPAGAIRAASEFALKVGDKSPQSHELREALEVCVEQAQRCGEIVHNILSFSRGEATDRMPADLRTIVARSCSMVAGYAQEGGARVESYLGDEPIPVLVNAVEIEQVLVNVLRNAVECVAGDVQVEVHAARLPSGAFVEVRDDGPGIDDEALQYLFDPFYTTRLEAGGTGLGLSVAHGIVNAHGGTIRAESRLGEGTTIHIMLPLHEDDEKDVE